MISFTGSTNAGAAVARTAAANITPALLELGGKNAFIVYDDADLDRAARDALDGGFYNKGEACTAASRVLVHRDVHDAFVSKLAAGVTALRVGSGADPATHVGPVVTKAQQQKVLDYIRAGEAEGAKIAAQAALPADPALAGGFFVPPTLFTRPGGELRGARAHAERGPYPVLTQQTSALGRGLLRASLRLARPPRTPRPQHRYHRPNDPGLRPGIRFTPFPAGAVTGGRADVGHRDRMSAGVLRSVHR